MSQMLRSRHRLRKHGHFFDFVHCVFQNTYLTDYQGQNNKLDTNNQLKIYIKTKKKKENDLILIGFALKSVNFLK